MMVLLYFSFLTSELMSKHNVDLKTLLEESLSEPEIYGGYGL